MPPAVTAVHHLFVRQYRAALRAPVHPAFFPVRQPALQHAQEEPLVPAVIFRFASRNLPPPVIAEAEAPQPALNLRYVLVGPLSRVSVVLNGRVFRWQAEGIPAHRMQHVESAHALHPRDHVPNRVVAHMAHVQRTAWVRQHLQHVILALRGVRLRFEYARFPPALLPLLLDFLRIVSRPGCRCAAWCALFRHALLSPLSSLRLTLPNSTFLRPRLLLCESPRSLNLCVIFSLPLCSSVFRNLFFQRRSQHRESLLRFRRLLSQSRQFPERRHVPPVIPRIINRRLRHKRPPRQTFRRRRAKSRVPQDSCKRLRPNFSFSNMFMPVYSPAEINLRIVHVKNRHVLQPDRALDLPDRRSQSVFALDVVSRHAPAGRFRKPAKISPTSSSRAPIADPIPAVFSIRIRSPPIGARFDACFTDSTIVEIACAGVDSPRDPGCTTRKSAPNATARTISSWNAWIDLVCSIRCADARLIR